MERSSKGHLEEAVNIRCFYLKLLEKIWVIPLAAVIGAIICAGIYTLVTVTFGPAKTYSANATLYISFAYDENKGTLVDYYNAYTWNNQLKTTDAVLNPIIDCLTVDGITVGDEDGNGTGALFITREELIEAINLDIPSDVRVMVATVTTGNKDLSDAVLKACVYSLENYGEINDAFDSIKRLGASKAKLDTFTDRSLVATVFGAILGAVIAIFALLLLDAMDDAVYVPEDCEKRYKLPVLGVLFAGEEKDSFFRNELVAAYNKIVNGAGEVVVISADSIENADISEKDAEKLKSVLGSDNSEKTKLIPLAVPGSVLDNYRKIGTCDGVILCVPYGKRRGAMAEHIIAQLKKHECPVLGLVLVRASSRFLRRYYGLNTKK